MAVMSHPARSDQPPEGLLLEQARERLEISQNEAGRRADISGTRWRQITYERASQMSSERGVRTLARMASVVGVTAEQLIEVGREDVANALRASDEPREPSFAELAAEVAELRAKVDRLLGADHQDQGKTG
jgi:transcriptional regulator with XRE-family HTH domain